ncbi:MAG: alanine--tRNA ligase [Alphaproteobacteria bacterium]
MTTANDIRSTFLDYFGAKDHRIVASSPLVPHNDPTLLFVNSGMVQFKNVFTGAEKRDYVRAVTSQKCLRAGGKHNDLENVGYTARHHTFFEMLGNFSFGDYFKDVAIEYAWNLVTKEFGLAADRLTATVYADDDESYTLWKKIAGLPEDRIIRISTSDNFWSMGDTGPCGPCSELFYDHGEHIPGGPPGSAEEDGDRFIEIWNLVFMQYEQLTADKRIDLPKPSVDTGMGLERVTAILQGTHDNYAIDLLRGLIEASAEATRTSPDGEGAVSHRVIADHMRACGFLIADGVLPSNEGRGYVLRRILRRAMRHAHMLGAKEPLMHRLVPVLVRLMGQHFQELKRAEALISETMLLEENRFRVTLDRGLGLLAKATDKLGDGETLPGEVAFQLYDTFGFPVDLTQDILRGQGRELDLAGFEAAMEVQRAAARKAWAGSGDAGEETVWFDLREAVGASEFLGYDTDAAEGKILAIVADGSQVQSAKAGDEVALVFNQTPFYAESGGQVGDTGIIYSPGGGEAIVTDVRKRAEQLHAHMVKIRKGAFKVGEAAELQVDSAQRNKIRANHSVTHLAHEALRQCLGDHVTQKGSLVGPERMRFDFSHPKPLTAAEIADVEIDVNARIRGNTEVVTRLMEPEAAIEAGALALFGEKYGEEVRVLSMGDDTAKDFYSTELCGGTHVRRCGDIGLFKIVGESSVAAGIRRIEVVTGAAAEAFLREADATLMASAAALKVGRGEVGARLATLIEDRRRLERELADAKRALAAGGGGGPEPEIKTINGIAFTARKLDGVPAKELKPLVDDLKRKMGSGVAVAASANDGKASLVVGVTEDLVGRLSAIDLVRIGAEALGGKGGGGRPDMAQAGGPDGGRAGDALAAIEAALAEMADAA